MPSRENKKVPATQKIPEIRVLPDLASYYANNTGIVVTPWDISLLFGRIVDMKGDKVLVDQFAKVTMSPQHAKAVHDLIGKQLEQYEVVHGRIPDKGYVVAEVKGKPTTADVPS